MEWLNYHHLLYFWVVAREGSIAAACRRLHLAQPTISTQIRTLERLGAKLFRRSGRRLALTETGSVVYRYAEDIFSLGRELLDTLRGRPTGSPLRLNVGVAEVLPKLVAYRLIEPALRLPEPVRLTVSESTPADLLARLAVHDLDVVLTDAPLGASAGVNIKGYSHLLGECGMSVFGTARLARKYRPGFPRSLDGAPLLLPLTGSAPRRTLERWLDREDIRPIVVGEFEDSALMKVFGQASVGLFLAPTVIETEVRRQFKVVVLGRLDAVREPFYAISGERRVKHPAVVMITEAARAGMFT